MIRSLNMQKSGIALRAASYPREVKDFHYYIGMRNHEHTLATPGRLSDVTVVLDSVLSQIC